MDLSKEEWSTIHVFGRHSFHYLPIYVRKWPPTYLSKRRWSSTYLSGRRATSIHLFRMGWPPIHLCREGWEPIYLFWEDPFIYLPTCLPWRRCPPLATYLRGYGHQSFYLGKGGYLSTHLGKDGHPSTYLGKYCHLPAYFGGLYLPIYLHMEGRPVTYLFCKILSIYLSIHQPTHLGVDGHPPN